MKIFNPFLDGYGNVQLQVWNRLRDQTLGALQEGERAKAAMTSPDEVTKRGQSIRDAFLESIGGLPPQDTPLNARTVGILARPGYHIEKVIFESQPKVYVTALLYIPDVMELPAPGILIVCGHGLEAKGYDQYQYLGHDIALSGMVALAVDPTGQGERITTLDPETREMSHGWGTTEHSYQGQQCILTGTNIARYFLHDALRAVDYLQSRPEVDPERIGITGNSGGGTQTTLVCMSGDPRIKAAVPCTYVTSREDYWQTGQSQDPEQIQFAMTSNGINFDDMFYPFAPRPLLIGAVRSDFFSPEGTALTHSRLQRAYGLFGKQDLAGLAWAPGTHRYHQQLREAMVNWFRVHLLGAAPDFKTAGDDAIGILEDKELWCTKKGHVLTDYPDARTPHHLNVDFAGARPSYASPSELRQAVAETLAIAGKLSARGDLFPRYLHEQDAEGLKVDSVTLISEPGITLSGGLAYPASAEPGDGIVYLVEGGTERFDEILPKVRELAQHGRAVLVLDVRGTGAVKAAAVNAYGDDFHGAFYNSESWYSFGAYCLGENLLGYRVYDVMRAADFLRAHGCERVAIHAEGLQPALWGYLAAALDEGVAETRIDGLIESYEGVVRTQFYRHDILFPVLAHGILKRFDLPDLRTLFEGRTLEVKTVPVAEST